MLPLKLAYRSIQQYKYELSEDFTIQIPLLNYEIDHVFFKLKENGLFTIHKLYKWDGVSGGMIDTDNSFIGGLVHDALYQAIRLELLPVTEKNTADKIMKALFRACGMSNFRSACAFKMVKLFGGSSCIPGDIHIPQIKYIKF